jgi:hypothetical protein
MFVNLEMEKRHFAGAAVALMASAMLLAPAESKAEGYIGASVGQAGVELDVPAVQPISFDEEDFAWKAFVGYNFGMTAFSLGLEAGYVDLGAPSGDLLGSVVEVDADGFDAFGTLGFDIGPVGVFAKYGVIAWDASLTVDGLDAGSDDGTDPAYGVGAKIGLGSVDIRAEYEVFDIEDTDDITMISVGIVWSF